MNLHLLSLYRNASRGASGVVLTVGFLVLVGWLLDIPTLTSILPGMATMKANSALGFILSGISLWSHHHQQTKNPTRLLANGCAAIVLLIGVLTLGEYLSNRDFGIDQLFFKDDLTPQNINPGRMSPSTALNFSLLGLALLLLAVNQLPRLRESFTIIVLIISILALIGYLYGIPSLYEFFPYSSIPLHTALSFSILSIGILFARPDAGLMKIFSSDTLGGVMARRLTPAAVVIPILLGWLFLSGQRMELYDSTLRLVLFAMSNVIIFAFLIAWNADLLSRVDVKRGQAEEALSASESKFRTLFETMSEGFSINEIICDEAGQPRDLRYLEVNPAFERHTSLKAADILGRTTLELFPNAEPIWFERYGKVALTGEPAHFEAKFGPLGRWFEVHAYQTEHGRFAVVFFDITERKQAEEEIRKLNDQLEQRVVERTAQLQESEEKFSKAFLASPAGVSISRAADGRYIDVNDALAKMIGYSREELIGHTSVELGLVDATARAKILQSAQIRGFVRDVEIQVHTKSKQIVDVLVSVEKIELSGQACMLTIQYDITERKRAEAAIQKAKLELEAANKELEAFSYSVSHDLRAPLRSIDGFSQALLEDYGELLPPEARNFLDRIRSSAQRMAGLIDDLLNLSRVMRARLKSQPVDLSRLAKNITAELQRTDPGRSVRWNIAPALNSYGDPNLLQVVLENLLNNAWKYTSKQEQAEIQFGSKYEDNNIIYFVRDNGAGFDMTYANKLFGAFQRLHAAIEFPGTGVGLATVQRIIHRHGGRVWAESAVGQGATFFFTLPALERVRLQTEPEEKDSLDRRVREII